MKNTQNIINDLTALKGATVRIFGQTTVLEANETHYLIDAIEIFKSLEEHEVDGEIETLDYELISNLQNQICELKEELKTAEEQSRIEELEYKICDLEYDLSEAEENDITVKLETVESYTEYLEEKYGLKEKSSGNTYNWSGNVTHDINYEIYECGDGCYYVNVMAHRFGDVRSNYTDNALYKFNSEYGFWEAMEESSRGSDTIEYNGKEYTVDYTALSNSIEILDNENDYEEIATCYGDRDDVIEKIKEYLEEQQVA